MAIDWPIAVDNDYAVWNAFANHYWPACTSSTPKAVSVTTGSGRATTDLRASSGGS
jgi:hypothetical protein